MGYPENIPDEFNIKKHGKFTANFVKVAPPIEPQFWIPIYGVIIGSIFGWSIPKMSEWIKGSKQRKEFIKYQKEIDFSYSDKLEMHDLKKLDGIMIK